MSDAAREATDSGETVLPLPAGYDLRSCGRHYPFVLRRHGQLLRSNSRWNVEGWNTLAAEDSPELRAFAADMLAAAGSDDFEPIGPDTPRDGSGFLAFGRHTIDNGRHWSAGDFWWAIILWDIWSGREPRWVFSKDGLPTWTEPSHWARLKPPRAVLAEMGAAVIRP